MVLSLSTSKKKRARGGSVSCSCLYDTSVVIGNCFGAKLSRMKNHCYVASGSPISLQVHVISLPPHMPSCVNSGCCGYGRGSIGIYL